MLPNEAYFQLTPDMRICRLLNGMWQVSGGHGGINPDKAIPNMFDYQADGFTTWDLADHYGPAEDFIGEFRRQLRAQQSDAALQAFTKWVPRPQGMTRQIVEQAVKVSLRRMDTSTLDMLQFHWWDYNDAGYFDALRYLKQLQSEGLIRHLALTNFDTEHLSLIIQQGIPIVSNQVQYSIIDRRPEVKMIPFGQEKRVYLLTYGTLCGGLLAEQYLGQPEPGYNVLNTASLQKYKRMIDAWGGWGLFQELLQTLKAIADKYNVSIANVATRYILDQPMVAGVIVGVRLGRSDHRENNQRVFGFQLDAEDVRRIHAITDQSRDLFRAIGDCGAEYRR